MDDISNLFIILVIILVLVSMWKLFQKAGRKGWEAIVPIYNLVILQKIINKPWYWVILMFIPYVGLIWSVWSTNLLSNAFGKGRLYTAGLVLIPFVFYTLLAFSDAEYTDPRGEDKQDAEIIA